jgi:signal transduction histidine kinase
MFNSARLKLTAWYILILLSVSVLFSVAIYQVSTREIQQLINRIAADEQTNTAMIFRQPHRPPQTLTIDELRLVKNRLWVRLLITNMVVLLVGGGASYFLAGKTLQPIKEMLDEHNQFITDASHELRTPIATLRAEMEASLLERKITDAQARVLIASNLEELSSIQELSNKLLQLAQSPTTQKEKVVEEVSVHEVITKAYKKVLILAKGKKIAIKKIFDRNDATILGNSSELTELFVILLDNAVKYSDSKTTVSIKTRVLDSKVLVWVRDEGYGIDPADLPNIFKRFYRADKSRSHAAGYGLGLAIANSIVDRHQGIIEAKSSPHVGTTFLIHLPTITRL